MPVPVPVPDPEPCKIGVMGRRLAIVLALGLGPGCFSESATPGGDGATTGEACTPQTLGCACEDGACGSGLACEPSIALCIDPSCTPGTELCTCVDANTCLQGLQCIGGLCRVPPPDGEDTSGGAATSGPMSTSTRGDDGATVLPGDADVTGLTDTIGPLTTSLTLTDDGSQGCGTSACAECYACQMQEGGACASHWLDCQASEPCIQRAACTLECPESDGECVAACCAKSKIGSLTYDALAHCLEDACTNCGQELDCGA